MATSTIKIANITEYDLPTANMTNISNASDGLIKLFISGNIVMMQFYNTPKIKTGGSGWTTLFTIPSGYRPMFQVRIPLIDDSAFSSGHADVMEGRIDTGGNFQIFDPIANHAVWGSVIVYFKA